MEPASTIIKTLGGPAKVAGLVGVHRTRVSNWMRPKSVGGTGGMIPFRHVPRLLSIAEEQGLDIRLNDFMPPNKEGAAA